MKSEILSDKWHAMKGKIQAAFTKLTDDDLPQNQGSADHIIAALQARYGYSKDQAQQEWDQFASEQLITTEDTFQQMADTGKATPNQGS